MLTSAGGGLRGAPPGVCARLLGKGSGGKWEGEQFRGIMNQKINKHTPPTPSSEDGEGLAVRVGMAEAGKRGWGSRARAGRAGSQPCSRSPAAGKQGAARAADLWERRRGACEQPNLTQSAFAITPAEGTTVALRVSDQCLCSRRDSAENIFATSVGGSIPLRAGGEEAAARSLQLAPVAQDMSSSTMRLGWSLYLG